MPNKKQAETRRLKRGDSLEIALSSDARFVINKTIDPGDNRGFILPSDISAIKRSRPGIRRLGYFGGFYGNRVVVYEYLGPNGIDNKSSSWFTEIEAIHSLKYIQKGSGIEIPKRELRKQIYKK